MASSYLLLLVATTQHNSSYQVTFCSMIICSPNREDQMRIIDKIKKVFTLIRAQMATSMTFGHLFMFSEVRGGDIHCDSCVLDCRFGTI